MKRIALLFVLVAIALAPLAVNAQSTPAERERWLSEVREYKHDYLAKQLKLTADQKTKFFEIYDRMDDEIIKANAEVRQLEKKILDSDDVSDTEYDYATDAILDLKCKECEIEKTYYPQLRTVLTRKQLFELKKAERGFQMSMVKHHSRTKK